MRDIAIARELRQRLPTCEIGWLAAESARRVLSEFGEALHPACARWSDETEVLEAAAGDFSLNLMSPAYLLRAAGRRAFARFLAAAKRNVAVFDEATGGGAVDLAIGDETYELAVALTRNPALKRVRFVLILDFVGAEAATRSPIESLAVGLVNRWWARLLGAGPPAFDLGLFLGEEEDIPDSRFGPFLPNRRATARRSLHFVGYVSPIDPAAITDRATLRRQLGYGDEPLVVCAIGGTAVGRALLELCAGAFPAVARSWRGLRMVIACGPRLDPGSLQVPPGVEVRGHVPELWRHLGACDLAVVQAGGTTAVELMALGRPFLYFPLDRHFEQRLVASRLARHRVGVAMRFDQTTPIALADAILAHIGAPVHHARIPLDGARRAADLIARLLPTDSR
jgi:hypothetical protein